jgi:hypothetical protein
MVKRGVKAGMLLWQDKDSLKVFYFPAIVCFFDCSMNIWPHIRSVIAIEVDNCFLEELRVFGVVILLVVFTIEVF